MLTQASTSRRRTESYKYHAPNEWHIKYTVLMAHNLKDIFIKRIKIYFTQ